MNESLNLTGKRIQLLVPVPPHLVPTEAEMRMRQAEDERLALAAQREFEGHMKDWLSCPASLVGEPSMANYGAKKGDIGDE